MTMSMINLMARMLERCWRRRKVVARPVTRRQNATDPENNSSPSIGCWTVCKSEILHTRVTMVSHAMQCNVAFCD